MNSENTLLALLLVYTEYFEQMPAQNIFINYNNKEIYEIMQKMKHYNYITLKEQIKSIELLTQLEYLYNLDYQVNDFEAYRERVLFEYTKYKVSDYSKRLMSGNYHNLDDAKQELAEINSLFDRTSNSAITPISQIVKEIAQDEQNGIIEETVDSYIAYIDNYTKLMLDMLVVIGARPSVGKTSVALNCIARDIKNKVPIAFFSLETSKKPITKQIACILAGVNQYDYRHGTLTNQQKLDVHDAYDLIYESKVFIDDSPRLDIAQIERRVKELKRDHGIKKVYIDYLQYINNSNPRCGTIREQVTDISKRLKGVAKENQTPVIALAQLNRVAAGGEDKEPDISHLKESGGIEQDADIIILLHSAKNELGQGAVSNLLMKYGKYRDGPQGKVYTAFNKANKRINLNATENN